jgi:hypothetical protein
MPEFISEVSLLLILFADSEGFILTGFIVTFKSTRFCFFFLSEMWHKFENRTYICSDDLLLLCDSTDTHETVALTLPRSTAIQWSSKEHKAYLPVTLRFEQFVKAWQPII